ncbi:phage tail protein [Paenibacillus sp. IHBB 10380]|uniref:phage tail protein n=1 Tax=Paenibacillus sp. IHBB 10380 TaxID=1566358 RepID=UPI0005CFCA17|nr:phage tail protein [Paenibacillus sp. IHBB 10380]AJS59501.1 hypothetical protein UB51_14685 [Paenibacillus sp. IHBB 10380]
MAFDKKAPDWKAEGIEPPLSKREIGWEVEDRPPAAWLNWYMNSTSESIQELQTKAAEKTYVDEQISEVSKGIEVDIPDASLAQKGIVQLSNAIDGTREDVAVTEAAIKKLAGSIASTAAKVTVTDVGNYYTSTEVEGSLQEIGLTLNAMRGSLIATTNAILGS